MAATLSAWPSLASHCATTSRPPPLTTSLTVFLSIAYVLMFISIGWCRPRINASFVAMDLRISFDADRIVDVVTGGVALTDGMRDRGLPVLDAAFDFGREFGYPLEAWILSKYVMPWMSSRWCAPRLRASSRLRSSAMAPSG